MSRLPPRQRGTALAAIKLLHTAVWFAFAACIVAIPIAGVFARYRLAAILTGVVLVECAVLAVNRGRCPLTAVAARYTGARAANFDIFLPLWLAQRNKTIFGALFVSGVMFVLARWTLS